MTTQNKEPNTTVPRDEDAADINVPREESEAAGRDSEPEATVPRKEIPPNTTVPRDND